MMLYACSSTVSIRIYSRIRFCIISAWQEEYSLQSSLRAHESIQQQQSQWKKSMMRTNNQPTTIYRPFFPYVVYPARGKLCRSAPMEFSEHLRIAEIYYVSFLVTYTLVFTRPGYREDRRKCTLDSLLLALRRSWSTERTLIYRHRKFYYIDFKHAIHIYKINKKLRD